MNASIEQIIPGRGRDLGDGFQVKRVLPHAKRRLVGPFIFFDQMGPVTFKPGAGMDVRPHPHIGLATVTYLFSGAIRHQDTVGVDAVIRPGDVNWMTAGHGVVHSERTPPEERAAGQHLCGIQTWVALPERSEDAEAAFQHAPADTLPDFDRDGARYRLILGDAWGHEAPVDSFSPIFYLHGELPTGTQTRLDIDHEERAVYLVEGEVEIDGSPLEPGSMAVLATGSTPKLTASADSKIMLCGGAPLGSRQIYWNFVASTKERLEIAKADWRQAGATGFPAGGRFTLPAGENEFIPLPDD